jgi:hypothetical protein
MQATYTTTLSAYRSGILFTWTVMAKNLKIKLYEREGWLHSVYLPLAFFSVKNSRSHTQDAQW